TAFGPEANVLVAPSDSPHGYPDTLRGAAKLASLGRLDDSETKTARFPMKPERSTPESEKELRRLLGKAATRLLGPKDRKPRRVKRLVEWWSTEEIALLGT